MVMASNAVDYRRLFTPRRLVQPFACVDSREVHPGSSACSAHIAETSEAHPSDATSGHDTGGRRCQEPHRGVSTRRRRPRRFAAILVPCATFVVVWLGILRAIIGPPMFDFITIGAVGVSAGAFWALRSVESRKARFSCKALFALTAYCCTALAVLTYPYFGWTIDCDVRLHVSVLDSVTGKPLPAATVRIEGGPPRDGKLVATTGDDGQALIVIAVEVVGKDGLLLRRQWVDAHGIVAVVSSPKYKPASYPIQGSLRNLHNAPCESRQQPTDATLVVRLTPM